VVAQGGDGKVTEDPGLLPEARFQLPVLAPETGYVSAIAAERVGQICLHLGGGRATKESTIDPAVGIVLEKKVRDFVQKGELLGMVHASEEQQGKEAVSMLENCYQISAVQPAPRPLIYEILR
jgi:pyrimidine-nucleoside phosphorylase